MQCETNAKIGKLKNWTNLQKFVLNVLQKNCNIVLLNYNVNNNAVVRCFVYGAVVLFLK